MVRLVFVLIVGAIHKSSASNDYNKTNNQPVILSGKRGRSSTPLRMTYRSLVGIISFDFLCIILSLNAILLVAICKEEKVMDKQMQKVIAIVAGSVAGVAVLGGAFYLIWNSKQAKAMRAVHRTNMILRRVGNVLCKIAAADEACV